MAGSAGFSARRTGGTRTPEYLQVNPKGKVPALAIDGRLLTENIAIVSYLAHRYPDSGLMPFGRGALADAQAAKYRRVCDQLRLGPGMDVLEIGCGWGGLMEMACARGAHVHGITLSEAQRGYTAQRLADEPRARVELRDYRDIDGAYDAVVSIEMFEAVGEAYWSTYFQTLARCLRHGGRALVQSITIDEAQFERYRAGTDFIQQFIFPGGMLPSRERFIQLAEQHGMRVLDRLDFGSDYAETLRRWSQRFEAQLDAVRALGFDDAFIRIWRLYFAYCEAGFDEGRIGVSQFLLERV